MVFELYIPAFVWNSTLLSAPVWVISGGITAHITHRRLSGYRDIDVFISGLSDPCFELDCVLFCNERCSNFVNKCQHFMTDSERSYPRAPAAHEVVYISANPIHKIYTEKCNQDGAFINIQLIFMKLKEPDIYRFGLQVCSNFGTSHTSHCLLPPANISDRRQLEPVQLTLVEECFESGVFRSDARPCIHFEDEPECRLQEGYRWNVRYTGVCSSYSHYQQNRWRIKLSGHRYVPCSKVPSLQNLAVKCAVAAGRSPSEIAANSLSATVKICTHICE